MKEPQWLLRETVLALHERLLAEFGGLPGIRDAGLLDSAVARPRQLYAYGKPSLSELASAYAYGLVRNHPFLDGNKRTAMQVSFVFLESNGVTVTASPEEACLTFLRLAAGEIKEDELALWFAEHTSAD